MMLQGHLSSHSLESKRSHASLAHKSSTHSLPKNGHDINDEDYDIQLVSASNNLALETYMPSISDKVKVGFYASDRATQTTESEIIILKTATENLRFLCREMEALKYDFKFAKNSAQSQFEYQLHNKSIEIYGKINEKFIELKQRQDEHFERIRRAFKSQMANELARVIQFYQEQLDQSRSENSTARDQNLTQFSQMGDYKTKYLELQRTVLEQELTIKELSGQMESNLKEFNSENLMKIADLEEARDISRREMQEFNRKVVRLEEALTIKDEECEKLSSEVISLQVQLEKEKMLNEQSKEELKELNRRNEINQQRLKKEFDKQKIQIETKLQEKMKENREQMQNAAKQELKNQKQLQQQREQEKAREIELLNEEKRREQQEAQAHQLHLAESLQRERELEMLAQNAQTSTMNKREVDAELMAKLRNNERYLKAEIARLKKELMRSGEMWEKKFDIQKRNMHALKNEMFLRQSIQKQSAQLSYASVAYTMDEPPQIQQHNETNRSSNFGHFETKKPVLPAINKPMERQFSFTISVPSRLSGQLDGNESQILGDDEMKKYKDEYVDDTVNDFVATEREQEQQEPAVASNEVNGGKLIKKPPN